MEGLSWKNCLGKRQQRRRPKVIEARNAPIARQDRCGGSTISPGQFGRKERNTRGEKSGAIWKTGGLGSPGPVKGALTSIAWQQNRPGGAGTSGKGRIVIRRLDAELHWVGALRGGKGSGDQLPPPVQREKHQPKIEDRDQTNRPSGFKNTRSGFFVQREHSSETNPRKEGDHICRLVDSGERISNQ